MVGSDRTSFRHLISCPHNVDNFGEPDAIAINQGEVKSLTTKRDLFNVAVKNSRLFPIST